MTWHTDLHLVDPPWTDPCQHLIAFIDDSSRCVGHSEMLPDNYMAGTAQALRNAIDPPPLRVKTDNVATVFLDIIRRRHIHLGECEDCALVADIEKARVPGNSVREFRPHTSLTKLVDRGKDTMPTYEWTPGSARQGRMSRGIATPKCSSYLLFNMRGA
jgi:hypothetical protein